MTHPTQFAAVFFALTMPLVIGACAHHGSANPRDRAAEWPTSLAEDNVNTAAVTVYYLEVVTAAVDQTCQALSTSQSVAFSDPVPELGNARTARLTDGGRIAVRAPLRTTETPVVRPYLLVEDIEAAIAAATDSGAQLALPATHVPGQGTFAIYILGGIEHGLWQR